MVSFGLAELAVLAVLVALGLLVVACYLALAAHRRTKRLERRIDDPGTGRFPRR